MSRNRGVNPNDTTRLPLSDGDFIEVRTRLTVGEERTIARKSARSYQQSGKDGEGNTQVTVDYDFLKFRIVQAASYIKSWNLLDYKGESIVLPQNFPLDKRVEIIEALDPDTQTEIEDALAAHIKTQQEARDAEKKARAGSTSETPSGATSPSAGS